MDKKIEEIVRKNTRKMSLNIKEFSKQGDTENSSSTGGFEIKFGVVVKIDSCQFPMYPMIDVTEDHYFHTVDGRILMFRHDQKSPYIFLPSVLQKAIFHHSNGKAYFVTLDTSNKLQYSVLVGGYPSGERHIISRNVVQVVQQTNRIFYISTKGEFHHVNTVWDDNGVLKGKMQVSNIKSEHRLSIFYANSTLFLNIDSELQREDGRKLPVRGDQICGIERGFFVLEKRSQVKVFLLDEECALLDEMEIPSRDGTALLFQLGDVVGIGIGNFVYILSVFDTKLRMEKEIYMESRPLALSMQLKKKSVIISKIVSDEEKDGFEEFEPAKNVLPVKEYDLKSRTFDNCMENDARKTEEDVERNEDDIVTRNNYEFGQLSSSQYEGISSQNAESFEGLILDPEPYSPYKSYENGSHTLERKLDMILKTQQIIGERVENMEKIQNERLAEIFGVIADLSTKNIMKQVSQEHVRREKTPSDGVKNIGVKTKEDSPTELKVLECVKRIILEILVPVVETSMDEMRIQVVNEMRLIRNEDHLRDVKRAVDNLHNTFNKQNEVKNLISQGLICKAAEVASNGSEMDMETFIANVETPCLESISQSVLVALLEKLSIMINDESKLRHQDFLYMLMVCLDLNGLNDDEISTLEALISRVNSIEGIFQNDDKGVCAVIEFQKLKLLKIKNKRGTK